MLLTIESSINFGSISLLDNKAEIGLHIFSESAPLSSTLVIEIRRLLEKNGIEKSQIKQILVSNGPGSLTGLRVGVGVAKSFANSLGIECFGVDVFKGLLSDFDKEIIYLILPFGFRKVMLQKVVNKSFIEYSVIEKSELNTKVEFEDGSLFIVDPVFKELVNFQSISKKMVILSNNLAGLLGKNFLKAQSSTDFKQADYIISPKYLEF